MTETVVEAQELEVVEVRDQDAAVVEHVEAELVEVTPAEVVASVDRPEIVLVESGIPGPAGPPGPPGPWADGTPSISKDPDNVIMLGSDGGLYAKAALVGLMDW